MVRRQQLIDKKLDKLFTCLKEGAERGHTVVKKEEVDEYFAVS